MIGTFTTVKYGSREDFLHDRPLDVVVTHNEFTRVGMEWIWKMAAGQLRDSLTGLLTDSLASARIVVGNGSSEMSASDERLAGPQTDQAGMDDGYPQVGGNAITFQATFGERDAIFEWGERGVVSAQGVLLDRSVADGGRKPLGAIWTVQAVLELTP